jgi:hypothetical protein
MYFLNLHLMISINNSAFISCSALSSMCYLQSLLKLHIRDWYRSNVYVVVRITCLIKIYDITNYIIWIQFILRITWVKKGYLRATVILRTWRLDFFTERWAWKRSWTPTATVQTGLGSAFIYTYNYSCKAYVNDSFSLTVIFGGTEVSVLVSYSMGSKFQRQYL